MPVEPSRNEATAALRAEPDAVMALWFQWIAASRRYAVNLAQWLKAVRSNAPAFLKVWWPWLVVLAVLIAIGFWWWLPKWQVHGRHIQDPKALGDLEDSFRKTITQLFGGIAVLVGAIIAYRQFRHQQRTTRMQFQQQRAQFQQQRAQFQEQQKAAQALLISNQVSKGFDQLGQGGDDKIAIRLGGIYALEGVMNASPEYHRPVLEALCAFVRDGTKAKTDEEPPAVDIQAALTVIGRRTLLDESVVPDLTNVRIPKADLTHATLVGARLHGADLRSANLTRANLSAATPTPGRVIRFTTNTPGLGYTIEDERLSTGATDLRNADLTGATLVAVNLSNALLNGANLSDAQLNGANLTNASLTRANLTGADLRNANLTHAYMWDACLSGANFQTRGSPNVTQAQLNGAYGTGVKVDTRLIVDPRPQAERLPKPPPGPR